MMAALKTCSHALLVLGVAILCARAASPPAEIPLQIVRDHLMVPVHIGEAKPEAKPFLFMLDTGYSMTMLKPGLAEQFQLRRTGQTTIAGIAGDETAEVFAGPVLTVAGLEWASRRVAAFPASRARQFRWRDGILGSGFFRRFVVEIDSPARVLRLHQPGEFQYSGAGWVVPLRFRSTTPNFEAVLALPDGSEARVQLELDTGCDSSLCLGNHFVRTHGLGAQAGDSSGRRGVGGEARTRAAKLRQFRAGAWVIQDPAANLFLDGSPAEPPLAGHVGYELLRPYRVFLDYSRRQMIVEAPPKN